MADAALIAYARDQAAANGVDPDVFVAQLLAESGGEQVNPDGSVKVSSAGARGIGQLMPATAAALGVDPDDPQQNVAGAARLDGQLLRQFGGDYRLMLAAYNAGPGAVRQYGGVPPFAETQRYVATVLSGAPGALAGTAAPDGAAPGGVLIPFAIALVVIALIWGS